MLYKTVLLGVLIGLIFIAFSLHAQPKIGREEEIIVKLDKILENQDEMFRYLKFIKNKV